MKDKIKKTLNKFILVLESPELKILPGQIAFYLLMSFIPILLLLSYVASILIKNFDLLVLLENNLPDIFANIFVGLVENANYSSLGILIFSYFLLASNGTTAIILASNSLYDAPYAGYIRTKIKSIIMIIIILLLMLFVLFIPIFGDVIFKYLFKIFGDFSSYTIYKFIYEIAKMFVSFIFIYISIKLLYLLSPNKKIKSKDTTIGALFASISWIIVTEVFAFYIANIAKYDVLYGNFANILILLYWIYFLSYCFVLGMIINIKRNQKDK